MRFLLDTNIWIHYLKDPSGDLATTLAKHTADEVVTCAIVRAELLHGAEKYGNRNRRVVLVNTTLAPHVSLPFDDAAAERYATIRHELEIAGQPIGPYDLQIAAICLSQGLALVTANVGEFSRVSGLAVEDWTASP